MAANWQQSVAPGTNGDFDGSGFVDDLDLTFLATNWRHTLDALPLQAGGEAAHVVEEMARVPTAAVRRRGPARRVAVRPAADTDRAAGPVDVAFIPMAASDITDRPSPARSQIVAKPVRAPMPRGHQRRTRRGAVEPAVEDILTLSGLNVDLRL